MTRLLVWCVAMLAAVAAAAVVRDDTYQELDVHMKLNGAALQYIEGDLRKRIAAAAPHNEVNFTTTIPHITLYLTEYVSVLLPDAIAVLDTLVPRLAAQVGVCNVTLGRPVVSGQYFMWNTEVPACLQQISDTITLELARFRNKNQDVPEWVYNLPEPDRSRRISLVRQYGSPGVFQFFNPQFVILLLTISTTRSTCPSSPFASFLNQQRDARVECNRRHEAAAGPGVPDVLDPARADRLWCHGRPRHGAARQGHCLVAVEVRALTPF